MADKVKVNIGKSQPATDAPPAKDKPAAASDPATNQDKDKISRRGNTIQPLSNAQASSGSTPTPKKKTASAPAGDLKFTDTEVKALEKDIKNKPMPEATSTAANEPTQAASAPTSASQPATLASPPGIRPEGNAAPATAPPAAPSPPSVKPAQPQSSPPPPQPQSSGHTNGGTIAPPPGALKGKPNRKRNILLALTVIVLGALLFFAYLQFLAPRLALARYVDQVKGADTGKYAANVAFKRQSGDSTETALSLTAEGEFDATDAENSKASSNIEGTFGLGGASASLRAEGVIDGDTLYVNLGSLTLFGLFGSGEGGDAWFHYDLNQLVAANDCSEEDYEAYSQYLGDGFLKQLDVNNPKRVSLLPETVDGYRAAHYAGTIDSASVRAGLDEANRQLPEQCRSQNDAFEGVEDFDITYDLWSGSDFDRLFLKFTNREDGSVVEFTLTTRDYGSDVTIDVPADSQPLEGLDGLDSLTPQALPAPSDAVPGGGDVEINVQ